jgi:hypothetical protein
MFACNPVLTTGGDSIVSAVAVQFRNGSNSVRFLSNFRWQIVIHG